jgi:hypothetical protein
VVMVLQTAAFGKLTFCFCLFASFLFLTTLPVLYSVDVRMISEYGAVGGMRIGRGTPNYSEKPCPSPTSCITNPKEPDVGSNRCRRGGMKASNRLMTPQLLDLLTQ